MIKTICQIFPWNNRIFLGVEGIFELQRCWKSIFSEKIWNSTWWKRKRGYFIGPFETTNWAKTERWLSGRKQRFAKPSYGKPYRGFESPLLRQIFITYLLLRIYRVFSAFVYPVVPKGFALTRFIQFHPWEIHCSPVFPPFSLCLAFSLWPFHPRGEIACFHKHLITNKIGKIDFLRVVPYFEQRDVLKITLTLKKQIIQVRV